MPLPIRRPAPAFAPAAVCLTMPHIAHAIVALVCSLVTMAVMFVLSAGNFEFRCARAEAQKRQPLPPASHACGRALLLLSPSILLLTLPPPAASLARVPAG